MACSPSSLRPLTRPVPLDLILLLKSDHSWGDLAFAAVALVLEAYLLSSFDEVLDPIASSMRLMSATIARSLSPPTSPVRLMVCSSPK